MAEEISLIKLIDRIQTDHDAYLFLEEMRWGTDGPTLCPHVGCGNDRFYFLKPKDGTNGRPTSTGNITQRRLWKCALCRKKFTVLTGTPMHGSKISARKWVLVIFEVMAAKNGVSAREIERKYDLSPKSAWFMLHRIREGMRQAEAHSGLTPPSWRTRPTSVAMSAT